MSVTEPGLTDGVLAQLRAEIASIDGVCRRVQGLGRRSQSRRGFLCGTGAVIAGAAGGLVLAGCGDTGPSASGSASPTPGPGDVAIATLAAGVELVAIEMYTAALKAAAQGAFGAVPAAVSRFAETAKKQHSAHLDSWNAVVTSAGKPAVTKPDSKLGGEVDVAAMRSFLDVARTALRIETVAAETCVALAAQIADSGSRGLALTIGPVEAQHMAVLNLVLGNYPVPAAAMPTDQARSTAG